MLVIKEQRCTRCEERPTLMWAVTSLAGNLFLIIVLRMVMAKDGFWMCRTCILFPWRPRAVINHHRAPLTYLLKSINIPIFTDSFHGKKDHMSRKRKEVSGETFCYLLRYIFPQYFIIFSPNIYYEDFQICKSWRNYTANSHIPT